ncbi:hypothetical protein AWC38_SpisGene11230 [Stylophora pistillata]|uniref:CARD domain-containing protein n=1 Tax=Stylophora pistillata TaxID=50429 RepID=A0A2B4S430_STYPI|nr:hypothetical protein AWC38_SpisGene11230 [Stylophora pistillata]
MVKADESKMANADDGPMGKNKRENLRKVREQLQDMDSRQVLQRMSTISNKKNIPLVFTGQDEERILGILDDFERSNSLVAALQKRGDRAYDIFRQALEEVHPHLKNILPGGENEVADFKEKEKEGRKKASRTEERHEIREIEKTPPTELDGYWSQFVLAARIKTGKDYEPSSLRGILASVERHLSRYSYGKTIFKDSDFKKTRDALEPKQKELKRHGLGNRPKATTALTDDEIEILFDKKLLGLS